MASLLRYILSAFAGAFLAMFAEPFFSALLQDLGIDTSKWAGPLMTQVWLILAEDWVRLVGAGVVGAAIGAWSHWLAISFDRRIIAEPKPPRPDTRLRIRLGDDGTFLQEAAINIDGWQQTCHSFSVKGVGGVESNQFDTLSITFEVQIDYERPIINTYGHKTPRVNFFNIGRNGSVLQFLDKIEAPIFEIWFPPIGYYDEKTKASLGQEPALRPLPSAGEKTQP